MRLAFATQQHLSFEQRSAIARALLADKSLAKLGRTTCGWLGALRLVMYFRAELKPAQVKRVIARVAAAKAAVIASDPVAGVVSTTAIASRVTAAQLDALYASEVAA